jgi:hypothetical protein
LHRRAGTSAAERPRPSLVIAKADVARPALDMYLGIAPEAEVVRRIREAADGK